jgi:NADPH:quinone reductase-like Zn-dependent oxidoreductase
MNFRVAAALSYNYLTAFILLFELGGIKNGQSVLYHSAGGGVGMAITQLLKLVNNVRSIATCSKNKFDALKQHVNHLIESNTDYVSEVRKICPEGVDLVLDCLSGENTNKGINLTKPLGKYIIYGISKNLDGESKNYLALAKNWWHVDKVSPLKLYQENRSLSGFNLHSFLFNQSFNSRRYIIDIYSKLFGLYRDGVIKPIIDSVHSFDDVTFHFVFHFIH